MAFELLNSITEKNAKEAAFDWRTLPITDIEWALLFLRCTLFSDVVKTSVVCYQPDCGAKIDVSFSIQDYLGQFQVTLPSNVEKTQEPGWFSVLGENIKFRLPTGNDRYLVSRSPQPEIELQKRCVVPDCLTKELIEQIQEYLQVMSPIISGVLSGKCPECSIAGDFYFDVQTYVLKELIDQAKFVFEDVHLLAGHYQWAEEAILNLPRERRYRYVEAIIRDRSMGYNG